MKPARIVSLVIGSLPALVGFGLLAGGGILGWALGTQRDADGFFTTSNQQFTTSSYALTSDKIDLGDPGPSGFGDWANANVRVKVNKVGSGDVFVGLAREADVESYLAGVPHDDITSTSKFGGSAKADYRRENPNGTALPATPATQTFWVAKASGIATQEITWHVEGGSWAIVVMNADGTPNVAADARFGGKVDHLVPIAIGLALGGFVLLAGGAALIVAGVVRPHARDGATVPSSTTGALPTPLVLSAVDVDPLRIEAQLDPNLSRWQWLVKWFLAIPHFVVLSLLWVAFAVLTVVAFFAILFTGRYPRSIFEFNVGVLRWTWRVSYYATSALGTDRYPPFTLSAVDYPATLSVAYPEHLSRGLVLIKSWLLALPQLFIVGVLTASWSFGRNNGAGGLVSGGLLGLLVLVAALILLFTGRYPPRLHDLVVGINRWVYRVIVYVALMTDHYPPFHLDQGSTEPGAPITATRHGVFAPEN
jgi:Domain of unknown function (DUF4389)